MRWNRDLHLGRAGANVAREGMADAGMQQSLGLMSHLAAQVGAIAYYLVASPLHHRANRVVPIGDQVGPEAAWIHSTFVNRQ